MLVKDGLKNNTKPAWNRSHDLGYDTGEPSPGAVMVEAARREDWPRTVAEFEAWHVRQPERWEFIAQAFNTISMEDGGGGGEDFDADADDDLAGLHVTAAMRHARRTPSGISR